MNDAAKIMQALELLVAFRGAVTPTLARYLRASQEIERWLETGDLTDRASVAAVEPHVRAALEALTVLGTRSLQVTGLRNGPRDPVMPSC